MLVLCALQASVEAFSIIPSSRCAQSAAPPCRAHDMPTRKHRSVFLLMSSSEEEKSTSNDGVVELLDDDDAKEEKEKADESAAAPFLSQGEIVEEALNPDLSDPKQARVIIYIILSLIPVLFLIPLMLGSRDLIPLDALPPVDL